MRDKSKLCSSAHSAVFFSHMSNKRSSSRRWLRCFTDKHRERSMAMERADALSLHANSMRERKQRLFIHIQWWSATSQQASGAGQLQAREWESTSTRERLAAESAGTVQNGNGTCWSAPRCALSACIFNERATSMWEQCHTLSPSLWRRPIVDEWGRAQAQESVIPLSVFTVRACTVRRHSFVSLHFISFCFAHFKNEIQFQFFVFFFQFSCDSSALACRRQTATAAGTARNCSGYISGCAQHKRQSHTHT